MKIISYCSFKGGAGKTTALMAICSSFINRGLRVALFEADQNKPISKWRENAIVSNAWDSNCHIFNAMEVAELEAAYRQALEQSFDYAMIDTHGGISELNNTIIASSDFLVLPTALTALDIDEALATYRYAVELFIAEKIDVPSAILKQRVPVNRLTVAQKASIQVLESLPVFSDSLHDRDAFATMKSNGLLHKITEKMLADPMNRLQARNYQTAMNEADIVAENILTVLGVN